MKEEMGRCQCKNSSNNLKNNLTPESSEHTTGRLEHPHPEEVEKIDIVKVIQSLKQDVKIPLKKWRKRQKKLEEINKSPKENQEKTIKQVKQTVQTVQDLKTEIEAIKKLQTEGIMDMENLGK